jgi:hypothetical protein
MKFDVATGTLLLGLEGETLASADRYPIQRMACNQNPALCTRSAFKCAPRQVSVSETPKCLGERRLISLYRKNATKVWHSVYRSFPDARAQSDLLPKAPLGGRLDRSQNLSTARSVDLPLIKRLFKDPLTPIL